jgi:hypothetical protein
MPPFAGAPLILADPVPTLRSPRRGSHARFTIASRCRPSELSVTQGLSVAEKVGLVQCANG